MKKFIFAFAFVCASAMCFTSCGNKTACSSDADTTAIDSDSVVADTLVADTVAVDSTVCTD